MRSRICHRCAEVVRLLVNVEEDDELIELITDLFRAEVKSRGELAYDDEGEDPLG